MLTLAIDTATNAQAIALTEGHSLIARRTHIGKPNHAETLLKNIDDILQQSSVAVSDLGLIAVGLGPGSFTGVRVGVATGKALALAVGCPVVGVSTLSSIARPVLSVLQDATVLAVIDARRGEVYNAIFRLVDGELICDLEANAKTPEEIASVVEEYSPTVAVGNALQKVPDLLSHLSDLKILPQPWNGPSAPSTAFLGQAIFAKSGGAELSELEPNYVRLSDAEIALLGRVP